MKRSRERFKDVCTPYNFGESLLGIETDKLFYEKVFAREPYNFGESLLGIETHLNGDNGGLGVLTILENPY